MHPTRFPLSAKAGGPSWQCGEALATLIKSAWPEEVEGEGGNIPGTVAVPWPSVLSGSNTYLLSPKAGGARLRQRHQGKPHSQVSPCVAYPTRQRGDRERDAAAQAMSDP
jgi:hypothetical protein